QSLRNDVVEKYNGHHSTGHMGTRYIYGELSRFGYGDIAQSMLNQTTYPSFGELFSRGATTIWEYWGEREIDETSNGTRSRSHPFQGGFDVWFYNGIGGINPDPENPGFKHIILKPQVIGNLTFANARFNSIHGLIVSEWEKSEDEFKWDVNIPANTTATVYVPAESAGAVTENGIAAADSKDLEFLGMKNGYAVFSAGSGKYRFIVNKK
ncbi:alpha-rhamnosidase, partial [bacterium]|nr:alpha-rhamnosidase [bacterium]